MKKIVDTYFATTPVGTLLSETVPSGTYAGTYLYLTNGQGSVAALTDSTGTIKDSYAYDPLGNMTSSGSVPNPFSFGGGMYDSQTGYYYTGSGYYDPANGQSFGCQDRGWVDPGEDLCGEDEGAGSDFAYPLIRRGQGRFGSPYFPLVRYHGYVCCRLFAQAGIPYSSHFGRELIKDHLNWGLTEEGVLKLARHREPDYIADEHKGYTGMCGEAWVTIRGVGPLGVVAVPEDVGLVWDPGDRDKMVTVFVGGFGPSGCPPDHWIPIA